MLRFDEASPLLGSPERSAGNPRSPHEGIASEKPEGCSKKSNPLSLTLYSAAIPKIHSISTFS